MRKQGAVDTPLQGFYFFHCLYLLHMPLVGVLREEECDVLAGKDLVDLGERFDLKSKR